jgi:hypothetical protein
MTPAWQRQNWRGFSTPLYRSSTNRHGFLLAPDLDWGIGAMTLSEARRHRWSRPILEVMAAAVISLPRHRLPREHCVDSSGARPFASRRDESAFDGCVTTARRMADLTESALLGVLGLRSGFG